MVRAQVGHRPQAAGHRLAVGSLLILLIGTGAAYAQDVPKKDPIKIEYERITLDPENKTIYLADSVRFSQGDFELRADRVLVWGTDESLDKPEEIYAEGNVRYRRGKQQLRVESMYYSFTSGKAYMTNLRTRAHFEKIGKDINIRADRIRGVSKGVFKADDITLSTCNYGIPHYDVYVAEGTLKGIHEREDAGPYHVFPYDEWALSGSSLVPRYEGIPIFWLPGATIHYPGVQEFPIRSVRGGNSSRFGTFVFVDWGLDLSKGFIDGIFPFDDDEADDQEKWGEWIIETDWREERGGAYGIDLEWAWDGYFGYIDTYSLHDQGRNPDSDFDRKFAPLTDDDRWRLRFFHRHDLSEHWRYELETSYLSDRDFLEEFFPKEFKTGKEQETVGYLRYRSDNLGAYLLEKHRLNDFQNQLELLPRLEGHLAGQPLADLFYFSSILEVSNLRLLRDEALNLGSRRMWRADNYNEVFLPIDAVVAVLSPFGGVRHTWFEDDLAGNSQVRRIWSVGGRVSTFAHGIHDVSWEDVGLRRLRHIVHLDARYASNLRVSSGNDRLQQFDEIDALGKFEELAFVLRNRFQTKTAQDETYEFLTIGLAIEYYPNLRRDTLTAKTDNHLPPFHWITLAPGETGGFAERHWSNLYWDLEFLPADIFSLRARGQYNPEDSREEVREISARFTVNPWVTVSFGQTLVRDVSNLVSAGLIWRPTKKWFLSGQASYDYERDDWVRRRVILGRDLHDFILEFNYERIQTRDDDRFYVTFVPKFLGKAGKRFDIGDEDE